jgi:hypothetical protein
MYFTNQKYNSSGAQLSRKPSKPNMNIKKEEDLVYSPPHMLKKDYSSKALKFNNLPNRKNLDEPKNYSHLSKNKSCLDLNSNRKRDKSPINLTPDRVYRQQDNINKLKSYSKSRSITPIKNNTNVTDNNSNTGIVNRGLTDRGKVNNEILKDNRRIINSQRERIQLQPKNNAIVYKNI